MTPCMPHASKVVGCPAFTLAADEGPPVDVIGQGRKNRCVLPWLFCKAPNYDNSVHIAELLRVKELLSTVPNRGVYWVRDFRNPSSDMTPEASPAWWVIKGMSDKNSVAIKLLW